MSCPPHNGVVGDLLDEWRRALREGPQPIGALVNVALHRGVGTTDAHRLLFELAAEPGLDLDRGARGEPELRMVAP